MTAGEYKKKRNSGRHMNKKKKLSIFFFFFDTQQNFCRVLFDEKEKKDTVQAGEKKDTRTVSPALKVTARFFSCLLRSGEIGAAVSQMVHEMEAMLL